MFSNFQRRHFYLTLISPLRISQVVKQSDNDKVLIIGAGITLVHAMDAAKELASNGISARVIDPFTIKPIDKEGIIANAKAAGGKIITVEDHYPEGIIIMLFIQKLYIKPARSSQLAASQTCYHQARSSDANAS